MLGWVKSDASELRYLAGRFQLWSVGISVLKWEVEWPDMDQTAGEADETWN